MTVNPRYLEIAVAAPIPQTLTYAAARGQTVELVPGLRLLVPLGPRAVTGYLLGPADGAPASGRIKEIIDILDPEPIFPAAMVPFYRWIAQYYHFPIGEVIKTALPGGLAPQSGRKVEITASGRAELAGQVDDLQFSWLTKLISTGNLNPATCRAIWRGKGRRFIEKWAAADLVRIIPLVTGQTVKAKTEICVQLKNNDTLPEDLKKSAVKTINILNELAKNITGPVPRRELTKAYSGASKAIKELAASGIIELIETEVYRDPFGEPPLQFDKPQELTPDQDKVLDEIIPACADNRFKAFLLHGVTGSGKTEVYLRAAAEVLAAGGSILLMVPEIALATQLEGHFISRFGDKVALLHSGLSVGEKFDQWMKIVRGQSRIVIGARSAIFAPLANLKLIIVDEEHDPAYKQEDNLRYQGRDLAVLRASQDKAVVILGSATPSIISFHHAESGKYKLLTMPKRVAERPMPAVEIIDLKTVPTVSGHPPLFTPQLTQALRKRLQKNEQSLVFLNRRGYANMVICQDCGQPVQCRHCQISLTLHQGKQELICHYCGYTVKSATICENCQSANLNNMGFGTERVEEELARLFPKAVIARLDRDTTANRKNFIKTLRAVHNREIDILVGTQMITKGHHFPHVTLVGVVWADAGLGMPDYKAGERTFQLLSQVTGRAGRGDLLGEVIIQTYYPEHYAIVTARRHDYQAMYDKEIELRRALTYPPFSRLANIKIEGESEMAVKNFATNLAARLKPACQRQRIDLLGPAPSPLAKLRGMYRWQILLKSVEITPLQSLCAWLTNNANVKRPKGIKMTVDVDPENML